MKEIYLENTKNGHYKYYKMIQISASEWIAEYGKIGNSPQRTTYNMNLWDKKYVEKRNKGYIEVSASQTPKVNIKSEDIILEKLNIIKNVVEADMQDLPQDYHKVDIKRVDSLIYKHEHLDTLTKSELQELNEIYKKYTL